MHPLPKICFPQESLASLKETSQKIEASFKDAGRVQTHRQLFLTFHEVFWDALKEDGSRWLMEPVTAMYGKLS